MRQICSVILLSLLFVACAPARKPQPVSEEKKVQVPVFSSDSAFAYVKRQCDFGPRVPGSESHRACLAYFVDFFSCVADTLIVQSSETAVYDGSVRPIHNVIASFRPESQSRIMLCAHWDSRPFADHDPDVSRRREPIVGANDGASGVGVLMELARLLHSQPPVVGVDIILFDLEDWGAPEWANSLSQNDWCLGSQYWASHPHLPNYSADYAVLLDMVGAPDARFYREYFSDRYASWVVDRLWQRAASLGLADYFVNKSGGAVTDDHIPVSQIRKIPAVDIIHYDPISGNGFGDYWHTHADNVSAVSPSTLHAVGTLLVDVIYRP